MLTIFVFAMVAARSPDVSVVRARVNPIIRPDMLKGQDGDAITCTSRTTRVTTYASPTRTTLRGHIPSTNLERFADQVPTCAGHVASPDVHIDETHHQIRMYFHCFPQGTSRQQVTFAATSADGLSFTPRPEVLGVSYFRVFHWGGYFYALAQPGILYRSRDGLTAFEQGPTLFSSTMRHSAVMLDGSRLSVFYTNVGEDPPERIRRSTIAVSGDWMTWKETAPVPVVEPQADYEGAALPLAPSVRGSGTTWLRELRDPCIFRAGKKTYLLYSVSGEKGMAIATLTSTDR